MDEPRLLNASLLCRTANGSSHRSGNGTGGEASRGPGGEAPCKLNLAVRVLLYSAIFLLGLCGNALVIAVLAGNKRLRTITNSFLLSLALSDLMVALFCLPFTFIPNLMQTFVFGRAVCKAVAYLMAVSVSVSTFSLVAIAIERYSAICRPLQSRVWQTRSHAYRVIAATWVLSVLLMLPYPVYSTTQTLRRQPHRTECRHNWPGQHIRQAWYMLLLITLFLVPGLVMIVAYGLISSELCRGIQFEVDLSREAKELLAACDEGDGCYAQLPRPTESPMELPALNPEDGTQRERARVNSSEAKLLAKKRVVRMLLVIVALFFGCWLPLYVVNTWRAFDPQATHCALSGAPISFIHLLSYSSTCTNPFVYCFMNKRFRQAFASTFACCTLPCRPRRRRAPEEEGEEASATGASFSKFSYTTVSSMAPPEQ
uniref:Gastrin/cholecystokinin type B receptor n=1 Tax=Pseudonaja textilis TaxID=8673 RepID=A0A670Z6T1_PSETE